jgi:hypothetical protein
MEEPQIDGRPKKFERADRLANIGALIVASAGLGDNKIDASVRRVSESQSLRVSKEEVENGWAGSLRL